MRANTVRIFNETDVRIPRKKITAVYTDLLRSACSLNVIGIDNRRATQINKTYRGIAAPASVLAFPSDTGPAELYLNMQRAQKTARDEGISLTAHLIFLCIHGMLHLLGYRHGPTMESLENEYATTYIYEAKAGKRRRR